VAAADLRARDFQARLVVHDGLHVLLNRDVPVLGPAGPASSVSVRLVAPGPLFERSGTSRVAGHAVLLPAGTDPNDTAAAAARAGAAIVLLAGDALPGGALGRDQALGVPVLGVPSSLLERARGTGAGLELSVGAARRAGAANRPGIPRFSSWGLGDGGHPKPEVAGPGVGVVTVDPGASSDGSSRFVLVDGTSAAAAAVAGEAAIVVEARPGLTAPELESALVGTARDLPGEPSVAQGNGLLDIGSAASAEIVSQPATLAFGRAAGSGWASTRGLRLRNVSTRWLRVYVSAPSHDPALALDVEPRQLTLAPGQVSEIQVAARLARATSKSVLAGTVTVAPLVGTRLRIPWAVVAAPVSSKLIGTVQLSAAAFKPSDVSPAILLVQLGQVEQGTAGVSLEPVLRLDIRLRDHRGKDLGLLSRLRDVLPGRYAFGLTGRGPDGNVLPAGRYSLGLRAFPVAGGQAVTRSVVFTIK
jgi:hypothetical protein